MKDTRRPEIRYKVPYNQANADEPQFDAYQFVAMLMSFQGVIFKQKIFFWVSLICVLSSFFNRKAKTDYKQYMMISTMIIFSFMGIYVTPNLQKPVFEPAN